ncbi:hypothetical protein B0A55_09041 [Friedmanniomyces simplex]|uniref:DNA ligase D 3'-phosphoesterase domain-containing protein n=1 Tax=Friedmanniomyces simplex TaxID=329884 RepID=A0A4U0WJS3_9PEZI|nr:hypothetical protein B0A55_09041 [Friedmanniomyces simplex]
MHMDVILLSINTTIPSQFSETSTISFAIPYGLPGNPNSLRPNRMAIETRVHNLWNNLIESASHATGSLLIWDTGEYEVLDRLSNQKFRSTDDELSDVEIGPTVAKQSQNERLFAAFQSRHIHLRLKGQLLPHEYTIAMRLPSQDANKQPRTPRSKRRRLDPAKAAQRKKTATPADTDSYCEMSSATDTQAEGDLVDAAIASDPEDDGQDAAIRTSNAYPGATNTIGSVHQRHWFVTLDRKLSGFHKSRRSGPHQGRWVGPWEAFYVKGRDHERSVVTGRLTGDVMADEGVEGHSFGAFEKLARLPSRPPANLIYMNGRTRTSPLSAIEKLPSELIGLILGDTDISPKDVIAFGMCSSELWSQTLSHIQRDIRDSTAPWAGKPMLCTGTWLTTLPPAIYELYPKEIEAESNYQTQIAQVPAPVPGAGVGRGHRGRYEDVEGMDCRQKWLDTLRISILGAELSPSVSGKLRSDVGMVVGNRASVEHNDWILRNLTTQQYVRLQLRRSEQGGSTQVYVAGARWLSLDQALILRICWGPPKGDPGESGKSAKLLQGAWSGHCFEVVEDAGGVPGAELKDVTAELVEEGRGWKSGKVAGEES